MAYGLKYTAAFTRGTRTVTLNIYQRDLTGWTPKEIMNIVDLRYGFTGQVAPDDPIAKTELSLTLIDAPDMTYGANQKGGDWQEFYVQDPTLYKVEIVHSSASEQIAHPVRWTGYITPDSWSEDLRYHGAVTITARDNLGHMQDFNFADHITGDTFTFSQLVTTAGTLIGQTLTFADSFNALRLVYYNGSANANMPAKDTVFFTETFNDGNIYDAMEKILGAYGLTLRWFDFNVFGICPIGYMTTETFGGLVERGSATPIIYNNSGHHSLNPSYRQIDDTINYEFDDDNTEPEFRDGPNGAPTTTGKGYLGNEAIGDCKCMLFNQSDDLYLESEVALPPSTSFDFSMSVLGGYYIKQGGSTFAPYLSYQAAAITGRFAIVWRPVGGQDLWLDAVTRIWQTTGRTNNTDASTADENKGMTAYSLNNLVTPSSTGKLIVRIYSVLGQSYTTDRYFSCVNDITIGYTLSNKTTRNKITTVNDPLANVKLSRTSEVGQYVGVVSVAQCVKNAMLGGTTAQVYGMRGLNKTGEGNTIRYGTVWEYSHRHILCAYAKTTSVIEGEIGFTGEYPSFSQGYLYAFASGAKQFYLCGGQCNVLTSHIESAVLREISDFGTQWPEYQLDAYTIVVEQIYSSNDDPRTVITRTGRRLDIELAEGDGIVFKGYAATPNRNYSRPKTTMWTEESGSEIFTDDVTEWSASDFSGHFPFEFSLDAEELPERIGELNFQCYQKDYYEQGASWQEIITVGDNTFTIYMQ